MDIRTALHTVADLAAQGALKDPDLSAEVARQSVATTAFRELVDRFGLDIERMVSAEDLMDASGSLPEIDLDDFRGHDPDDFAAMRLIVLELACQQFRDGETDPGASDAIDLVGTLMLSREAMLRDLAADLTSPSP